MTCPVCCGDTKVVNTYDHIDHIVRQRNCLDCGYVFHTVETDRDIYQRLKKDKDDD